MNLIAFIFQLFSIAANSPFAFAYLAASVSSFACCAVIVNII
jgi:hypothetical protein